MTSIDTNGANTVTFGAASQTSVTDGNTVAISGSSMSRTRKIVVIVCTVTMVLSCIIGAAPFVLMLGNKHMYESVNTSHTTAVNEMDKAHIDTLLKAAEAYNAELANTQSRVLGEAGDPFTQDGSSVSANDVEYNKQLNRPDDGIMSRISYPALDIDLPVYHGTGADALRKGAGHMYGTSLPVGGNGTHAVLSAHTGYPDKLYFDNLHAFGHRAKIGDVFYVTTLGEQLGYKVTKIETINPDDFTHFAIDPMKDQVTLLTCTPYGVNSQRLLVTGERVDIPGQVPTLDDAPKNNTSWMLYAAVGVFIVFAGVATMIVVIRMRRMK